MPWQARPDRSSPMPLKFWGDFIASHAPERYTLAGLTRLPALAGETGIDPAPSGVTGRRSNQLSYSRFGGGEALGREPGCVKRETACFRHDLRGILVGGDGFEP